MMLPRWDELTDADKTRLERLAGTFGIELPTGHLILPNNSEAKGIAMEMFTISRGILARGDK